MSEDGKKLLNIIDMHTAGEPVRIIDARHLDLVGDSLLERRAQFKKLFDHLRRAAMREPRGHADMYGVVLIQPSNPIAQVGAIFIHNSGYSSMCGHVCIALGRFLSDECAPGSKATFIVETPCGLVPVSHDRSNRQSTYFSAIEVPGEVISRDSVLNLGDKGRVRFDICYGGAYYAILSAADIALDFSHASTEAIGRLLTHFVNAARAQVAIPQSGPRELAFLYGAILCEHDRLLDDGVNRHICWFGNGQIDRSPTGSGVAARLALASDKKEAELAREYEFSGVSGLVFSGKILAAAEGLVQTLISGQSYYIGRGTMIVENEDPVAHGFVANHLEQAGT